MKRTVLLLVLPIAVVLLFIYVMHIKKSTQGQNVHYHAGFLVYIDGTLQDYSGDKYMLDIPCAAPGKSTPKNNQLEKAHLHDGVGDVVHVEQSGAVWNDVFSNMNIVLQKGKPIAAYSNGKRMDNPLTSPILPDESVVFVVGDDKGIDLTKSVSVDHIKEAGEKSESCN